MALTLNKLFSFRNWSAQKPTMPQPGDKLDDEFAAIRTAVVTVSQQLDDVRRTDGKVKNGAVVLQSLDPTLVDNMTSSFRASIASDLTATTSAKTQAQTAASQAQVSATSAASSAASAAASASVVSANANATLQQIQTAQASAVALQTAVSSAATAVDNAANDAEGAAAVAQSWGEVSHAWAEYMPGQLPPNILAVMGITGDHWSARWWANHAAQTVSDAVIATEDLGASVAAAAASASGAASSAATATTKASEAATSATNAASSASSVGASATSAASSAATATTKASEAAISATNAASSASTATTKASEAAISATNAASSASTATTKASQAATSATNAAASATSAASAQVAAESARDATLAAYDSFDDRYLGVKASDPTVDNDGNPLVAGSLYFSSTVGAMKVYTGSAWVAAYVSGAGTLVAANNLSDLTSSSQARTNLGVAIGSNVQAWDADLDAIAALAGTAGLLKKTAANTWTLDTTSYLSGSVSLATGVTGTLPVANGGTGLSSLTAGYVPFGNGTGALGNSANLFWDNTNGRLGVGTSGPTSLLHLYHATASDVRFSVGGSLRANMYASASDMNLLSIGAIPLVLGTNGSERMRIDSSGNVGVGTNSPTAKLDVNGSGTVSGQPNVSAVIGPHVTSDLLLGSTNGNSPFIASAGAYPLVFFTNASERMRIDSAGRIGIGVAPVETVDVVTGGRSFIQNTRVSTDANGPIFAVRKARGSVGSPTILSSSDTLGGLQFYGYDGAAYQLGSYIASYADGTPSAGSMPGNIVAATAPSGSTTPIERLRIDSAGGVGIGSTSLTGYTLRISKNATGSANYQNVYVDSQVQSDVTGLAYSFSSYVSTAAAAFTLTDLRHFTASQATFGAGSSVTNQYGYFVGSSLTGATNNYGVYSNIASGTGRWNFYANGTADNYFAGSVGIGAVPYAGVNFNLAKSITGGTASYNSSAATTVQSDVTSAATNYSSYINTAAAAFTLTNLRHFWADQGTIGAGSSVTNQYGFQVNSTLTGATNNYGFYANIASGTGRWNFYANGTAANYFAGNVGIGTTSPGTKLDVTGVTRSTAYQETKTAPAISAGTLALDCSTGNIFAVSLNANITTLSFSNVPATGTAYGLTLMLTADGTARTVTWGSAVKWPGGTAPTLTSTLNKIDTFVLITHDGGTTWYAFTGGQNS